MRILAVLAALAPLPVLAHGVHTAPVDGHSHSFLPVALGVIAVAALAYVFIRARR